MSAQEQSEAGLICSVLAAQAAALRERIETAPVIDLLWRASDVLAALSGWIAEAPRAHPAMERQRAEVLAHAAELSGALDKVAFAESQRQDFSRQMADCLVTALERLSGRSLSANELAALYVSEDQHAIHQAVIRREASGQHEIAAMEE